MKRQYEIKRMTEINDKQFEEAIYVFVDSFQHLFTFAKNSEDLIVLFRESFVKEMIYVYIEDEKVLGFLGIATNKQRPLLFSTDVCKQLFGNIKGGIIYKQLNAMLTKPVVNKDDELYIDHLATSQKARGKGIGTTLLKYAFAMPGYTTWYLEVLSKNLNAKRLYESLGFVAYKKQYSLLALQGVGNPIKMKKQL